MTYLVNVSLPETLAQLAKHQVKSGYYSSLSEVIRAALRKLLIEGSEIPTFNMSKKAEKIALRALNDYKKGKTKEISSFGELE